jgi:hypothetical protein
MIAAAGTVVRLWDARTGALLRTFTGHEDMVTRLTFSPDGRALASASRDTTVLLWEVPGASAKGLAPAAAGELGRLWDDLASRDAARAHRAVQALAAAPRLAVPFLASRLRPVPAPDPARVARWARALGADDFAERERATVVLARLGDAVEGELLRLLRGRPSAEARRRAERLLGALRAGRYSPGQEQLRQLRAVEALEGAGTPEARRALRLIARGAAEARLTREARAALGRLEKRVAADR